MPRLVTLFVAVYPGIVLRPWCPRQPLRHPLRRHRPCPRRRLAVHRSRQEGLQARLATLAYLTVMWHWCRRRLMCPRHLGGRVSIGRKAASRCVGVP